MRALQLLQRHSPRFRRLSWAVWYRFLARRFDQADWTFMNYGWWDRHDAGTPEECAPLVGDGCELEAERYPALLYHRVASAVPLEGKRLLEVGCGRGGGLAFVHRVLRPRESVGVDLSEPAVRLCRRLHTWPGLSFEPGDAEALPFPEASFDAVLNVESSHCYASMARFLAEVRRVLVPGGHLLLADLRDPPEMAELYAAIDGCGLQKVEVDDITPDVVAALDRDHERKIERIEAEVPRPLRTLFEGFAATRGSRNYREFASGGKTYLRYVLRK